MSNEMFLLMIHDLSEDLRQVRLALSEKGARLTLAEREIHRLKSTYEQEVTDGEEEESPSE